jgi:protein-S-isoprenylcysteine O-methyltransferase Ste14
MDTARYVLAVLVWIGLPPAIVHWLCIHPFVDFWRRLGKAATFWIVALSFVGIMVALYVVRDRFVVTEFGTHWALWVAAAATYAVSIAIEIQCRRHLKLHTLVGAPEIDPDQTKRKLLGQGIYARVRHPRYLAVMFGTLSMALFTNYLAVWILLPVTMFGLYAIAVLEERELVASMGGVYEEYRQRVPMFIPRGPDH